MRGIASHQVNFLRSVQNAYDNDLISRKVRDTYVANLALTIEKWPGIRPLYVEIYQEHEALQGRSELVPIAELIAAEGAADAVE